MKNDRLVGDCKGKTPVALSI